MKKILTYTVLSLAVMSVALVAFRQKPKELPELKLQPGFKAEHLFSPSENDLGSWVAMCFDNKGRLITSDQYGGLFRMKLPSHGKEIKSENVEKLVLPKGQSIGTAHGLLYAFNSLFVMVNNRSSDDQPQKSGLYRLTDTNGDDEYDKIELLKGLTGYGEHGPHSIKLSPDGKSLYVIAGNYTDLPEMNEYKLPKTWAYDNLFPEIKDPRGHANDRKQPGGWVAKVEPDKNEWTLISAGYRNPFDLAFNDIGDLFVYDADMEWDFGLPWYRPTRICLATEGSEYGWRTGDGKWKPEFTDNLPPVINIGQGSPTNLLYLSDAKFPHKYKNALLAFDWSFGIMHVLKLSPNGGGYKAEREEFLSGVPLPLTDGAIGPDGALYFMTGGRRLSSDLYRVSYEGPLGDELPKTEITPENRLRRELEASYDNTDAQAVQLAWDNLAHPDRYVRYAARVALEHKSPELWKGKIADEKNPQAKQAALLALVRCGGEKAFIETQLKSVNAESLNTDQKLDLFRTYEVLFSRLGTPEGAEKARLTAQFEKLYPAKEELLNVELSKLLLALQSPGLVKKTLKLIASAKREGEIAGGQTATSSADLILRNPQYGLDIAKMLEKVPPVQQTYFAVVLCEAQNGWTPALRKEYFKWFKKAFEYRGGNSYIGFIDKARKMALQNVPESERDFYDELSGGGLLTDSGNDLKMEDYPQGPGKSWSLEAASGIIQNPLEHRNFKRGKAMYIAATCNRCHSMQGEGGNVGPDLTRIGTRFSKEAILEAIVDPSKTISDQYAATEFQLKNGESIVAKIISEDDAAYTVSQNPYAPDYLIEIKKSDVLKKEYSKVSVMLPGLINALNEEELKDLLAYLIAGGNEKNELFD
ncbi:c-type cytochrome [Marinilongibacter aquaticus]|uniref:c-type cytochrome n=1 Tax=Marinilongibacter aquaticus TaxID=2975157 RepID=UPI0021BD17A6|nr:c-type cytochrome [Marinilongibacter aquaticus]UBM57528.1 c-type cytochrome [Marinilongibacter aquaticus]